MAGVLAMVFPIVTIIEGQFFSGSNLAPGHNPYLPLDILGVAVRSATVIEEAGRVPAHAAVDVPFVVQFKDETTAASGYTNGQIFGIDRAMLKANGAPVTEGSKTGLGPNSIALSTSILAQSFYIAVWQNKTFMVILGIINFDSATGQKVSDAENKRIK